MATYTSNYAWTKPEGGDPVDITVLNGNLDSQDNIVHNAYMQLAPVFSSASTYAVDDVVLYANNLYKCITAVTVAGDWDSTKWTQVKVSDIAGGGGGGGTSDYTQLTNKPSINSVTLSGNKTSADLGLQDVIQLSIMPSAGATYAGKIVQFVGTTDATYTHGYYYECANNGGAYTWTQLNVQPSSGGGTSDYSQLSNKPSINSVTLSGNKTASQLGLMASDGVVANPTGQTSGTLTALEVDGTKYAVGSGGTSDYTDLTNKPQINGVTLTGNKSTSDLGINASAVGLGNVPNVATDDQTPTFTTAQSRNNLVSGEKLSVMLGKISKFFNDLKTVAFTGNYKDLTDKPQFDTMPTAGADYSGDVVQYVGATTASYTHGYYYECVNNGGVYSWVQTNVQPSGGSGSGHTIVNGAGTSMTQRDALQFTGGLSVSDDSTNERTVVSGDYELITWTDWQTILADHEEDLHPNAIITGAPGADGDISVELMTKLWENPSPTSSFASQNITLSSADYDLLLIIYRWSTTSDTNLSVIAKKGQSFAMIIPTNGGSTARNYERYATYTDETHYAIDNCSYTGGTTSNNNAIPIAVYGIKTTASVKISAIAESVSTSADKCMLDDGVTSVEDAINYSSVEKIVGQWYDGKNIYRMIIEYNGILPKSQNVQISTALKRSDIDTLIDVKGYTKVLESPFTHPINTPVNGIAFDNNGVVVWQNGQYTNYTAKVVAIIDYTKNN